MRDLAPMLRLDLLTLVASRKMLAIYVLVVCFLVAVNGALVALPMIGVASMMVCLNLFGTIENHRLTQLYGSLPLRRRTVMVSHYAVTAVLTCVFVLLGALAAAVAAWVRAEPAVGVAEGVGTLGALLLVLALVTPAYVAWGTRTGGLVTLVVVATVIGGLLAFGDNPVLAGALRGLAGVGPEASWWVLGAGVLAQAASLVVSIGVYTRQDH